MLRPVQSVFLCLSGALVAAKVPLQALAKVPVLQRLEPIAIKSDEASRVPGDGVPGLEQFLYNLRGGPELTSVDIQVRLAEAVAGRDYPILSAVPDHTSFSCDNVQLSGYYVDVDASSKCQAFYRCGQQGAQTSYLCPNQTVFNQVLLTCDWFFNVICDRSTGYYEWANSHMLDPLPIIRESAHQFR